MEVFTEEWAQACCERLNARAGYRAAAPDWEAGVVLLMTADHASGVAEDRAFYLDLFRGECRGTRTASAADLNEAPYVLSSDPAGWGEILSGSVDPLGALLRGRLRLARGSLMELARYSGAAKELVAAAAAVPASFPGTSG